MDFKWLFNMFYEFLSYRYWRHWNRMPDMWLSPTKLFVHIQSTFFENMSHWFDSVGEICSNTFDIFCFHFWLTLFCLTAVFPISCDQLQKIVFFSQNDLKWLQNTSNHLKITFQDRFNKKIANSLGGELFVRDI